MTIERAHKLLDEWYETAHKSPYVHHKVAWAIFQVWKIAEIEAQRYGK